MGCLYLHTKTTAWLVVAVRVEGGSAVGEVGAPATRARTGEPVGAAYKEQLAAGKACV